MIHSECILNISVKLEALLDKNTYKMHSFQRNLLIGFFTCEENWSECISGYTWISIPTLSPHVLSLRAGALGGGTVQGRPIKLP